MKKIVSLLVALLLLTCCFCLTASAEGTIIISNDYENIYMNGSTYSRFNTSRLNVDYTENVYSSISLSEAQQETIERITLQVNEDKSLISAEFNFKDGSYLTAEYMNSKYLPIYEDIVNNYIGTYVVDFVWPEENQVRTDRYSLIGSGEPLVVSDANSNSIFDVYAENEAGTLSVTKGYVVEIDNEFYYVDYDKNGFDSNNSIYTVAPVFGYKITDKALLEELEEAMDEYYKEDFGFFLDDSFSDGVSRVFIVFVFAVLPLAVLIVSLIFAIRSKGVYRKLCASISILSGIELTIFIVLAILLSIYS